MKKILLALSAIFSITTALCSYAQTQAITSPTPAQEENAQAAQAMPLSFALTNWTSKNATDNVVIQNGNGDHLVIEITVIGNGPQAAGVLIKNCGSTSNIKAGGTAICSTNDSANPVTFSSDSAQTPASGTYQVKKQ